MNLPCDKTSKIHGPGLFIFPPVKISTVSSEICVLDLALRATRESQDSSEIGQSRQSRLDKRGMNSGSANFLETSLLRTSVSSFVQWESQLPQRVVGTHCEVLGTVPCTSVYQSCIA